MFIWIAIFAAAAATDIVAAVTTVDSVSPPHLGDTPGIEMVIKGTGFAEDQFNEFDSSVGNTVNFVNELETIPCHIITYKTSTTRIVCTVGPRKNRQGPESYQLALTVNGEYVDNDIIVVYASWISPQVNKISPSWGLPGDLVKIEGYFHTSRYLYQNASDPLNVPDPNWEHITELNLGKSKCDPVNPENNTYYVDPYHRYITCLPEDQVAGPKNADMFVVRRGESRSTQNYNTFADIYGKIYKYFMAAEYSLETTQGSTAGYTPLTISGSGFGGDTKVSVGGAECELMTLSNTEITCLSPPQSSTQEYHLGGMGLTYEVWSGMAPIDFYNDALWDALDTNDPNYSVEDLYSFHFNPNITGSFVARVTGCINIQQTGLYTFGFDSNADSVALISPNFGKDTRSSTNANWQRITMTAGSCEYLELRIADTDGMTKFKMMLKDHQTTAKYADTAFASTETHKILMDTQAFRETLKICPTGNPAPVQLSLNGMPSENTVNLDNSSLVVEEIYDMISYKCEFTFESGTVDSNMLFLYGYESSDDTPNRAHGQKTKTIEPFCGRVAYEESFRWPIPWDRPGDMSLVDIRIYPYVCMAIKSTVAKEKMGGIFKWTDTSGNSRRTDTIMFNHNLTITNEYQYACVDMKAGFDTSWAAAQRDPNTGIFVERIYTPYTKLRNDSVVIDAFAISRRKPLSVVSRPGAWKPQEGLIHEIRTKDFSDGCYQIEFETANCASGFPLLGIHGSTPTVTSDDLHTYTLGSASVSIERTTAAGPPPTGTFELEFAEGKITGLPYDASIYRIQTEVEAVMGKPVSIRKYGNCNYYSYYIDFDNHEVAHPLVKINSSADTVFDGYRPFQLTATQDRYKEYRYQEQDNYPYLFRKVEKSSSTDVDVTVTVNGYPSKANGNTKLTYAAASASSISSIALSADSFGTYTAVLTGTGFTETDPTKYTVQFGDSYITPQSIDSTTSITFIAGKLSAGRYDVHLFSVAGGMATESSAVFFELTLSITRVEPTNGPIGGGYTMVLYGEGFPQEVYNWFIYSSSASESRKRRKRSAATNEHSVTVGGNECEVFHATKNTVSCTVPAGAGGDVDVVVNIRGKTATSSFTYNTVDAPQITGVNQTDPVRVGGGVTISISGTAFTNNKGRVKIGENFCMIKMWSASTIECTLPANPPEEYPIIVLVDNIPASGSATITYELEVQSHSSGVGSSFGGTPMVFNGIGFGEDPDDVEIKMGDMVCEISSITDTMIECETKVESKRHYVTVDPDEGFLPQRVVANVKDVIVLKWDKRSPTDQVLLSVYQTENSEEVNPMTNGQNTGDPAEKGEIILTSSDIKSMYFSTNYVNGKHHVGRFDFKKPDSGKFPIEFKVSGQDAMSNDDSSAPSITIDGCPTLLDAPLAGCTVQDTEEFFYFVASECYAPIITSVTVSETQNVASSSEVQITTGAVFTIDGSGFGTDICQMSVKLGDALCSINLISETSISCSLVNSEDVVSFSPEHIVVQSHIGGNSFLSEDKYMVVALVDSFSPQAGSLVGGTEVTITGSGFESGDGAPTVRIGNAPCIVEDVSFDEIICKTTENTAGSYSINVLVSQFNIAAIDNSGAQFEYTSGSTPILTSVSEQSTGQLTIDGSNFGTGTVIVTVTSTASRKKRDIDEEDKQEIEMPKRSVRSAEDIAKSRMRMQDMQNRITEKQHEELNRMFEDIENLNIRSTFDIPSNLDLPTFDPHKLGKINTHFGIWKEFERQLITSHQKLTEDDLKPFYKLPRRIPGVPKSESEPQDISPHVAPVKRNTDMTVSYECIVVSNTDTSIVCDLNGPAGTYTVNVYSEGMGNADASSGSNTITTMMTIAGFTPSSGSTHGGTLITISGAGFPDMFPIVNIGGGQCQIMSSDYNEIQCYTTSGSGANPVSVSASDGTTASSSSNFEYSAASSPQIDSLSASTVVYGDSLTITGSKFSLGAASVEIGLDECVITSSDDTSISCLVPDMMAGSYAVVVTVDGYGYSNDDQMVTYDFAITSVTPNTGGLGGIKVEIAGTGFSPDGSSTVSVCGAPCPVISGTTTSIICQVPPTTNGDSSCDIVVTNPTTRKIPNPVVRQTSSTSVSSGFSYSSSLSSSVTSISPAVGGTAGGTTLTIDGTDFADTGNEVHIDGSICIISSESATQIVCVTEAHLGPGKFNVDVEVPGIGLATYDAPEQFFYVDRWSSVYTWGGDPPPATGDLVQITEGQTIMIDKTTDVVHMIFLDGGHLVFDCDASQEIVLKAKYILILNGGSINIGSEESPCLGEVAIELHGRRQDLELPIYGNKVMIVREGQVGFFGKPIAQTWTTLSETADAGANIIKLSHDVDWPVGSRIVVATTEFMYKNGECEERFVKAVIDSKTLELDSPLNYKHISMVQTFGSAVYETRAEVGILSRNVDIRGNQNLNYLEMFKDCEVEFDSNQFATQQCFLGLFGDEALGDDYGAQVFMFSKQAHQNNTRGRFSYVEVYEAGQDNSLGRYPLHYHLEGDLYDNYVIGCGIYNTYNRAVTIHSVNNLVIERNVIWNNQGHAIFTEDGNEENNVIRYNLVMCTRGSSSLLNVDITPSSYWLVNPNNIVEHNHAAGGESFGYWYMLLNHPTGPSATPDICQNKIGMGSFKNNSAHSYGRYGLWIFSMDGYWPRENGCNGGAALIAKWEDFTAWNNERGAEHVFGHNGQFINMILGDNLEANAEMVLMEGPYGDSGSGIYNSTIIGRSDVSEGARCTFRGVVSPKEYSFTISGTSFYNFDMDECVPLEGCAQCKDFQGGYGVAVEGLSFNNCNKKVKYLWESETHYIDTDGSLIGDPSKKGVVIPNMGILDPSKCSVIPDFSANADVPGAFCENTRIARIAMYGEGPSSLTGGDLIISNQFGSVVSPYRLKRLIKKAGWMVDVPMSNDFNDPYVIQFNNSDHVTNITYKLKSSGYARGDEIFVKHEFFSDFDNIIINSQNESAELSILDGDNGAFLREDNDTVTYIISRDPTYENDCDGSMDCIEVGHDEKIEFKVETCAYEGCIVPTPPPVVAIGDVYYSAIETWQLMEAGNAGHEVEGTYEIPIDTLAPLIIPEGMNLIYDLDSVYLGEVYVFGSLTFLDGADRVFRASHIIIADSGSVTAGSADAPFQNELTIALRGNLDMSDPMNTEVMVDFNVPTVGWKAIGVNGLLSLHGKDVGYYHGKLDSTINPGDTTLQMAEAVTDEWLDKEILVSTTSKDPREAEVRTVTAISPDYLTLTVESAFAYEHLSAEFNVDGTDYTMKATVGIIERNVKVVGDSYPSQDNDLFGGRIFVYNIGESAGTIELSNVELNRMGQDGFPDEYDPRYAVAVRELRDAASASYIKKSVFRHVYNTGFGIFDSHGFTFDDNIIYDIVEAGVRDATSGNIYNRNAIVSLYNVATIAGRFENQNFRYMGGFHLMGSTPATVADNVVSGCEQVGFRYDGEDGTDAVGAVYSNNEINSCMFGVMVWTRVIGEDHTALSRISSFHVWRSSQFAFYSQTYRSIEVADCVGIDSLVGVLPIVYSPPSLNHIFVDKSTVVKDSTFIAYSPFYTQEYHDQSPPHDQWMDKLLFKGGVDKGALGVVFGLFISVINMAPKHAFFHSSSYPALGGSTKVSGVTLINYQDGAWGSPRGLSTNPFGDDAIHPTTVEAITWINSDEKNKLYLFETSKGPINPSDCVDMECDGQKQVVIHDLDGSVISAPGNIIGVSEQHWGSQVYGVGDFRIPNFLKQDSTGALINSTEIFPNKGIYRHGSCVKSDDWNAYGCTNSAYKMMIFESMDGDTEVRRLSPIAYVANYGPNGFVDLVNGPQDQGWCFGYTCQERISTFYTVLGMNIEYTMAMTSTPPQHMRFTLSDSDTNDVVLIKLFHPKPQRFDIYVDGIYVPPTNVKAGTTTFETDPPTVDHIPTFSDPIGTNVFFRDDKFLYILVRGGSPVDVKTIPEITMTFGGTISEADFYEGDVLGNLANFFGISSANIKITNIIREDSLRRRKRETGNVNVQITVEISPEPTTNVNDTASIDYDDLMEMEGKLVNNFQTGSEVLPGLTVEEVTVVEPIPPPENPPPPLTEEEASAVVEGGQLYSETKQQEDLETLETLTVPKTLSVPSGISVLNVPTTMQALIPPPQIDVVVLGDDGSEISVGTDADPWIFAVRAISLDTTAKTVGYTEASFIGTSAAFNSFAIAHPGEYVLEFMCIYPLEATDFIYRTDTITVTSPNLGLTVEIPEYVRVLQYFSVSLKLVDLNTQNMISPVFLEGTHIMGQIQEVRFPMKKKRLQGPKSFTVCADKAEISGLSYTKNDIGSSSMVKITASILMEGASDLVALSAPITVVPRSLTVGDATPVAVKINLSKSKWSFGEKQINSLEYRMVDKLTTKSQSALWVRDSAGVKNNIPYVDLELKGSIEQQTRALNELCRLVKKRKRIAIHAGGRMRGFKIITASADGTKVC